MINLSKSAIAYTWYGLGLLVAALVIAGIAWPTKAPKLSSLLNWLKRSTWGRWLLLLGWMWVGWHFFVR